MKKAITLLEEALELLRSEASPRAIVTEGRDLEKMVIEALIVWFRESKIRKGDFAKIYGCQINHISRLLNGTQGINLYTLNYTLLHFGYGVKVDMVAARVSIEKINR